MHLGTERFERLTYFFVMTIMIVSAVYRDKVNMGETLLFLVYQQFQDFMGGRAIYEPLVDCLLPHAQTLVSARFFAPSGCCGWTR